MFVIFFVVSDEFSSLFFLHENKSMEAKNKNVKVFSVLKLNVLVVIILFYWFLLIENIENGFLYNYICPNLKYISQLTLVHFSSQWNNFYLNNFI